MLPWWWGRGLSRRRTAVRRVNRSSQPRRRRLWWGGAERGCGDLGGPPWSGVQQLGQRLASGRAGVQDVELSRGLLVCGVDVVCRTGAVVVVGSAGCFPSPVRKVSPRGDCRGRAGRRVGFVAGLLPADMVLVGCSAGCRGALGGCLGSGVGPDRGPARPAFAVPGFVSTWAVRAPRKAQGEGSLGLFGGRSGSRCAGPVPATSAIARQGCGPPESG